MANKKKSSRSKTAALALAGVGAVGLAASVVGKTTGNVVGNKTSNDVSNVSNIKSNIMNTINNSNVEQYIYSNMMLIFPFITYLIFNFFRINFFEGYTIKIIELFFMIIMTTIPYYFSGLYLCNENSSVGSTMRSLKFSLVSLLFSNIITILNPCKTYMTFGQSNIIYMLSLLIIFNLINYMIEKNNSLCALDNNKIINLILIVIHIILAIYNN
jgi:hypothetical protein